MTQSEAGILFCVSALCLFTYGITIAGFIIDKLSVKWSLMLGLSLYATAKFILIFADTRAQLYAVMVTLLPLGASIIFPGLMFGVKKLTHEDARAQAFSIFYAAMTLGAVFGGPTVDLIRIRKYTTFDYIHNNNETGQDEIRYEEFSSWRTICFFGLILNGLMLILLCFYNPEKEKRFLEKDVDWGKYSILKPNLILLFCV